MWLFKMCQRTVHNYSILLKNRPVATTILSSGAIAGIGDYICQTLIEKRLKDGSEKTK